MSDRDSWNIVFQTLDNSTTVTQACTWKSKSMIRYYLSAETRRSQFSSTRRNVGKMHIVAVGDSHAYCCTILQKSAFASFYSTNILEGKLRALKRNLSQGKSFEKQNAKMLQIEDCRRATKDRNFQRRQRKSRHCRELVAAILTVVWYCQSFVQNTQYWKADEYFYSLKRFFNFGYVADTSHRA